MSTTYNMAIVGSGSAIVATLQVTITYGTATSVIATKGSKTVGLAYDSTNDIWTGNLDSTGTWTVYATDGVRTVSQTVNVDAISVYDISIAAPNVPLGYTQLEWISSNGAQIDTGYQPVSDCCYYTKMQFVNIPLSPVSWNDPFGARSSNNNYMIMLSIDGNASVMYFTWRNGYVSSGAPQEVNWNYTGPDTINTISTSGRTITVNGTSRTATGGSKITSTFGSTTKFGYKAKTWYFQMTASDGSTLVRDMVPVKRQTDSEVGMWDKVNNVFYTSSNSSKFTAGPEVN